MFRNARTFNFRAVPIILCELTSLEVIRVVMGGTLTDDLPFCFNRMTELKELYGYIMSITYCILMVNTLVPFILQAWDRYRFSTAGRNLRFCMLAIWIASWLSYLHINKCIHRAISNANLQGTIPENIGVLTSLREL